VDPRYRDLGGLQRVSCKDESKMKLIFDEVLEIIPEAIAGG
jgi:hypothetical protein